MLIQDKHDCNKCAYKRQYLDINIEQIDIQMYEAINTKVMSSRQATVSNSLDALGSNITEEQKEEYFEKAFKTADEARMLEVEWWTRMKEKYNLPTDRIFVDIENYKFYVCLDSCGQYMIDFKAKDGVDK